MSVHKKIHWRQSQQVLLVKKSITTRSLLLENCQVPIGPRFPFFLKTHTETAILKGTLKNEKQSIEDITVLGASRKFAFQLVPNRFVLSNHPLDCQNFHLDSAQEVWRRCSEVKSQTAVCSAVCEVAHNGLARVRSRLRPFLHSESTVLMQQKWFRGRPQHGPKNDSTFLCEVPLGRSTMW